MSSLVVTGYASLDYPVTLEGQALPDTTTLITGRNPADWPRVGGCPTYIAAAASRAKQRAAPVMWIGSDDAGLSLLKTLEGHGITTAGIGVAQGRRSPSAVMVYQADGSCLCLYDPALAGTERLDDAQRDLIARASHLCISVGPPALQGEILDLCPSGARLYWAVKNDPDSFGPQIRERLSRRADVIFHSAPERHLIGQTRAVLVETRGAGGVGVTAGGRQVDLPVTPVTVRDTTGAGDTFSGGFIAAEMAGADPVSAAKAGIAAVAEMLRVRQQGE